MKRYFRFAMFAFMMAAVCSCSSKQDPIDDLEDLSNELKEDYKNFSSEDWEKAQEKFVEIENKLNEYEYSDEELKKIGKLKAKCAVSFTRGAAKMLNDNLDDIQKEFEGAAEELQNMFEE